MPSNYAGISNNINLMSLGFMETHAAFHKKKVMVVDDNTEFLEKIKKQCPDIVFMDVEMPVMNGIEATKQAHVNYPEIEIIGLSSHSHLEYMHNIIIAGAKAFITKSSLSVKKLQELITG